MIYTRLRHFLDFRALGAGILRRNADGTLGVGGVNVSEVSGAATAQSVLDEATARAASDNALSNTLALKAPLASPVFSGTPTAPTPTTGDASTKLATTQFVDARLTSLLNAAPASLDTLGEIATQLASDESAASALTTTVAAKLTKSSNLSDLTNVATARTNLGLGSVDNTADATKPVSTAQATAIAARLSQGQADVLYKPLSYQPTASNISDSTAAGRALLTAADAAAQRTALGVSAGGGGGGTPSSISSGAGTLAVSDDGVTLDVGTGLSRWLMRRFSSTGTLREAASIEAVATDPSDALFTTELLFQTRTSGGARSERMRIGRQVTVSAAGEDDATLVSRPGGNSHGAALGTGVGFIVQAFYDSNGTTGAAAWNGRTFQLSYVATSGAYHGLYFEYGGRGGGASNSDYPHRLRFKRRGSTFYPLELSADDRLLQSALPSAPDDALLSNSTMTAWYDEANNLLTFRIRRSDGTLVTKTL